MSLSVREKILLFLLAIIAIAFLGLKFLIFPLYQQNVKNYNRLKGLTVSQETAAQKVSGAKSASSNLQKEEAKAVSTATSILPEPQNYQLNVWVVNLAQSTGLAVNSISFSSPVAADITATASNTNNSNNSSSVTANSVSDYLMREYAQSYLTGSASSSSNASNTSSASSAIGSPSSKSSATGGLLKISVNLEMTGQNIGQVEQFLNAVKNSKKTVVVTTIDSSMQQDKTYSVNATIDCYGAEKLDNSDTTFKW